MLGVTAVVLAILATLAAAVINWISFGHHNKQALRFWEREQKLPDATRYENLQLRIEESQSELDRIKDQLFDARMVIDEAERQRRWMEETKAEVASLEIERKELLRVESELETLQTQLAELSQLKVDFETRLADLKSQHEDAQRQHTQLQQEIAILEERKRESASIEADLERLRKEQGDEEARIGKLKKRAGEIKSELEVELRGLKKQCDAYKTDLAELTEKVKEFKELEPNMLRQIEALQRQLEGLTAQEKTLSQQVGELKPLVDQLNKERTNAEKELDQLKDQVSQHRSENGKLEQQAKQLQEKVDNLAATESRLRNEVGGLEAKSNALTSQLPVLQSAFESLSAKVNPGFNAKEIEESDIWQPILMASKDFETSITELDALANLKRQLEQHRLKFHERTIHAFHTALKTSDSSPLVVLAGVSGTGKSELPRRYSDAMGLHFLNMAVQPRWDSPQDLFGFYDYLEQKFRPTELTRALIQMDEFQNENDRGWSPPKTFKQSSCSPGLLLVLLDEMNLARVEYYFSEFLSKLETRRGVKINDRQQRMRAEMVLEVSGRQSNAKPMQLFVGNNVLFVGTMNEDETTQSLSDKVMDRANVLRFGSPSSVNSVYEKKPAKNGLVASSKKLSNAQWKSWTKNINSLEPPQQKQMLDWISRLRTALDGIRRPFAYRVAQSMLEYAANYPDVNDKLKFVIADQIEQKVLPRLRGIDPQDRAAKNVFDVISTILDEAADDVLARQIKDCCGDHYFQWIGLDRYEELSTK